MWVVKNEKGEWLRSAYYGSGWTSEKSERAEWLFDRNLAADQAVICGGVVRRVKARRATAKLERKRIVEYLRKLNPLDDDLRRALLGVASDIECGKHRRKK